MVKLLYVGRNRALHSPRAKMSAGGGGWGKMQEMEKCELSGKCMEIKKSCLVKHFTECIEEL